MMNLNLRLHHRTEILIEISLNRLFCYKSTSIHCNQLWAEKLIKLNLIDFNINYSPKTAFIIEIKFIAKITIVNILEFMHLLIR